MFLRLFDFALTQIWSKFSNLASTHRLSQSRNDHFLSFSDRFDGHVDGDISGHLEAILT